MEREIIITKDGSHSLLHKELNETYHSVHGALQESEYVFIEKGLRYWWEQHSYNDVAILEVGFGTGLNALLSLIESLKTQGVVSFATLEAFPLASEVWSKLNYCDALGHHEMFEQLHTLSWNNEHLLLPSFRLRKCYESLQDVALLPDSFDLIFYDAFAPSKQPEMWELAMLEKVYKAMRRDGVFVTYCAKGQLKRDLRELGMKVETLQGPPGKKEMVRGTKL